MELLPEIDKRISARGFLTKSVPKDILDRILEAGRRAPSAKNRQPWRFIVIQDAFLRDKIADAAYGQDHVRQAPVIIAVCTTNVDYRMPNGLLSYPIDLTFATSFMMLQAQHEGLGSCIVTTYQENEIEAFLTVPWSMKVVMLLTLGYTEDPSNLTTEKFPLARIVSYDHW